MSGLSQGTSPDNVGDRVHGSMAASNSGIGTSSAKIGIAAACLNQLSLDYSGNYQRIMESIDRSRQLGATIRTGPELEITGYSIEDAWMERDTELHSWQILAKILSSTSKNYDHLIIDVGMPVQKDSSLYNCRVIMLRGKIILIIPKTHVANIGNYREGRWFKPWFNDHSESHMVWFRLPSLITQINGQKWVPFGATSILEVQLNDQHGDLLTNAPSQTIRIGFEICEEVWRLDSLHTTLFAERGCHIVCNSSGSLWDLRKTNTVRDHIRTACGKVGGCYVYSNLVGNDGGRLCFFGRSMIVVNGNVVDLTSGQPEDLYDEVQVAFHQLDASTIETNRAVWRNKLRARKDLGRVLVFNGGYTVDKEMNSLLPSIADVATISIEGVSLPEAISHVPMTPEAITAAFSHPPEEELAMMIGLWLWDYLRRCGAMRGFILPLSGGIDSSAVASLVYCMCRYVYRKISGTKKDIKFLQQLEQITSQSPSVFNSPESICHHLLHCVYLETRHSGIASRTRAENLSKLINAQFTIFNLDKIYSSFPPLPQGNDSSVTLAQQNLQARLRMVLTYYFSGGQRLVLSSGNLDECLVGYLTKYDCSSGDLNPIGSISKQDLRRFMRWFRDSLASAPNTVEYGSVLNDILNAVPSAELTGEDQSDEKDMGLTYYQLSVLGRLRRGQFGFYGPYGMFCKIWSERNNPNSGWADISEFGPDCKPERLAEIVKRFFTLHAKNRHKQTVLTPSVHAESYSCDDNRFDLRQFLYNTKWTFQFELIDQEVKRLTSQSNEKSVIPQQ